VAIIETTLESERAQVHILEFTITPTAELVLDAESVVGASALRNQLHELAVI
jgi:hypothetical protein